MKALKTLALVSLSTLGFATVQADEPVKTQPQTVTQGQYVESNRTPRLFGRKYRSEIVQTSGTVQTTPSTTAQPSTATTATTSGTTSTPVVQQPVQRRGLFGKLRSRRSSNMTTTSNVTSSTATTSSDAKPMPLGK